MAGLDLDSDIPTLGSIFLFVSLFESGSTFVV